MRNVIVYTLSFFQDMEKKVALQADPWKPLERSQRLSRRQCCNFFLLLLVFPALLSFLEKPTSFQNGKCNLNGIISEVQHP